MVACIWFSKHARLNWEVWFRGVASMVACIWFSKHAGLNWEVP